MLQCRHEGNSQKGVRWLANFVVSLLALAAAVWIGFRQNKINGELRDISQRSLISSTAPLLSIGVGRFEYGSRGGAGGYDIIFFNKGVVPINILEYEVDYPGNALGLKAYKTQIPGTLFQGESVTHGANLTNGGEAFQDRQLIVLRARFVSIFDAAKSFCAERRYIYDRKASKLTVLELSSISGCMAMSR